MLLQSARVISIANPSSLNPTILPTNHPKVAAERTAEESLTDRYPPSPKVSLVVVVVARSVTKPVVVLLVCLAVVVEARCQEPRHQTRRRTWNCQAQPLQEAQVHHQSHRR